MNAVRFLFFAQSADWVKRREAVLRFDEKKTVSQILKDTPDLSPLNDRKHFLKVAINQELADFETEIKHGDEIAILPPFSGG